MVEDIMSWRYNRKQGYILEVDLEYPEELHDAHNADLLAPESACTPRADMSLHQQALVAGQPEDNTRKLLLTLQYKEKYVLHYLNLHQFLSLGMRLKKVHQLLRFEQQAWMKPYIELNTNLLQAYEQLSFRQNDGEPKKPHQHQCEAFQGS